MGFSIKYETDEERLAAIRHSKNNYSNKPFTCSHLWCDYSSRQ